MCYRTVSLVLALLPSLFFSVCSFAAASSTVTFSNDYLFNGISQTNKKPAIQVSLDFSKGYWYIGTWTSNVNFSNGTDVELDMYGGYSRTLGYLNVDFGVAGYQYFGSSNSSQGNYQEFYIKFGFQKSQLSAWYSADYFGTGAAHYIVKFSHEFELTKQSAVILSADRSTSLDKTKYVWQINDASYWHWQLGMRYQLPKDWIMSLDFHQTDLKDYGETRMQLILNRSFEL